MRWIDGNEINIKQFTGETLCEKLATELWGYAPNIMRSDFLSGSHQEYDITTFEENHEIEMEVEKRIIKRNKKFYLNSDFDIWPLLFKYLDEQIQKL